MGGSFNTESKGKRIVTNGVLSGLQAAEPLPVSAQGPFSAADGFGLDGVGGSLSHQDEYLSCSRMFD